MNTLLHSTGPKTMLNGPVPNGVTSLLKLSVDVIGCTYAHGVTVIQFEKSFAHCANNLIVDHLNRDDNKSFITFSCKIISFEMILIFFIKFQLVIRKESKTTKRKCSFFSRGKNGK